MITYKSVMCRIFCPTPFTCYHVNTLYYRKWCLVKSKHLKYYNPLDMMLVNVQTSYCNHNPSIFDKSHKLLLFEKWLEIDHKMQEHYAYLKWPSPPLCGLPPANLLSLAETLALLSSTCSQRRTNKGISETLKGLVPKFGRLKAGMERYSG